MAQALAPLIPATLVVAFFLFMWKKLAPGVSRLPWLGVLFVGLGCLRLEAGWDSGYSSAGGVPQTVLVLGLVALVFLWKASRTLEDLLLHLDALPERIAPKYGILLPVGWVLVSQQLVWGSAPSAGSDGSGWRIMLGDPGYAVPFLLALYLVLKLGQILRMLNAARRELDDEAA